MVSIQTVQTATAAENETGFCVTCAALVALVSSCCALIGYTAEWAPRPDTHVIAFSGYDWLVKASENKAVGPGPNFFSGQNVWVRDGELHLQISERDGRWYSAEIVSAASFGFGTYRFTLRSDVVDLDPNVVLGLFTWSDDAAFSHREIDIEISRWGDRAVGTRSASFSHMINLELSCASRFPRG
jgi:hypothetical protein